MTDVEAPDLPVAGRWFSAQDVGGGVTRLWEPHVHPLMQANIWHVRGGETDLLVDAGMGVGDLPSALREHGLAGSRPLLLVVTHAHADHHGGAHAFWPRIVHRAEAAWLAEESDWHPLVAAEYSSELWRQLAEEAGEKEVAEPAGGLLVTALPAAGFRPREHTVVAAVPTIQVDEGDVIDLGDRAFTVLHLPGHSPGSIALWEAASGTLFAGDVIYDEGALLDGLAGSSISEYCVTMRRLLEVPARTVYAGHGAPFGRELLRRRAVEYLRRRDGGYGR